MDTEDSVSFNRACGGRVITGTDPVVGARPRSINLLMRNRSAVIGLIIVLSAVVCAVGAPVLAPYSYSSQALADRLQAPNSDHLLGTDKYGRDILSRLMWGGRASLQVGVVAVAIAASLGTFVGLISGYVGGWIDNILMRLVEAIMTLPTIVLALVMVATLGQGMTNIMLAVGITMMPAFARVIRGSVLSTREMEFVEAAHALGIQNWRIMARHILPNTTHTIIVLVSMRVATAILIEATLSFLGLGAGYDRPTWGAMINEGKMYLQSAPWLSVFPGFAIMLTVLGLSLLGDGLRDVLDPRLRT